MCNIYGEWQTFLTRPRIFVDQGWASSFAIHPIQYWEQNIRLTSAMQCSRIWDAPKPDYIHIWCKARKHSDALEAKAKNDLLCQE